MSVIAKKAASGAIKTVSAAIDFILLMLIILLLVFASYALWDSVQIYSAADKSNYAVYKPAADDEGLSFKELQTINNEVVAWLSVYGTNIDYPVTQSTDNMKYVNTNAEGQYSLSGAIFLDCGNNDDYGDFNSILYGHHMEKYAMFGEIGSFADKTMFEEHRYANLYHHGRNYGVEFFAFLHTDAYDGDVFSANVQGEARQPYLDGLMSKALHTRDIGGVTIDDNIILLSTCSSTSTNGRDILIGVINNETYEDPFYVEPVVVEKKQLRVDLQEQEGYLRNMPSWWLSAGLGLMAAIILSTMLLILISILRRRKKARSLK